MATCLDIITYAMRQAGVLGSGEEPTAAEGEDGLVALQSMYDDWRNRGMFGQLEDVYLSESDTAQEGKRYFIPTGMTLTDATSVYTDSSGNTRQPRDLALYETLTQAGTQTAKLYDRTQWVDLLDLTLSDTAPLSKRNAYGLAACLSLSGGFQASFGESANPIVAALCSQFTRQLMGKIGSTQDDSGGTYY